MRYDVIKKRISQRYRAVNQNGITYFMNKFGEVVATENAKHNLLVMYVYSNLNTVWNHHDTVAVAIAKDFKLVHKFEVIVADVIVMNGLCGATNTIQRTSNMLLEVTSATDVSFDEKWSNFVEPVQIIDRGILDLPQFSSTKLNGALIDVKVRDAKGKVVTLPYVVGKGLVSKPNKIGTMGHMISSTIISLEIGLTFDMSRLVSNKSYHSSHIFNFDNLVYGILHCRRLSRKAKKKKAIKYIQPKDYTVYTYLRKKHSWYCEAGYNTCNSDKKRKAIQKTENGSNYHEIEKVSVIF
jgi:hypothetical protein